MALIVGNVYRYGRPYSPVELVIDGVPNYFQATHTPGQPMALLERGINQIADVHAADGARCPAILISSSPHKIGSRQTPWQDVFDSDNGFIRYYGDNKVPGLDPALAPGNKALLNQFVLHTSTDAQERSRAAPILVFRRVASGGARKGYVRFEGFGVLTRAQRISQYNQKTAKPFANYVFEYALFSLAAENEVFEWTWIAARRNKELALSDTIKTAPESWRRWIKEGAASVEACRRRVSRLRICPPSEQAPSPGSREAAALREIYAFYHRRKHRFEFLASEITAQILGNAGQTYVPGWLTPRSADGGTDFVGCLHIGSSFSRTRVVVLGQAKCERLNAPTGGGHIARTVARLRRGWIGVYVTTSYFSPAVQLEVIEDSYPIILIPGRRLAEEALLLAQAQGHGSLVALLETLDVKYEAAIRLRRPEEILLE